MNTLVEQFGPAADAGKPLSQADREKAVDMTIAVHKSAEADARARGDASAALAHHDVVEAFRRIQAKWRAHE